MGQVAGEKYLERERERETPMVARSTEEKEEEYFI